MYGELGVRTWYFCLKTYLNQKYQLPVHQSIWEPVHLKSPHTSKMMRQCISVEQKSLMVKGLEQASQWHEMYCHDLEVVNSNPIQIQLGAHSTSALRLLEPKLYIHCFLEKYALVYEHNQAYTPVSLWSKISLWFVWFQKTTELDLYSSMFWNFPMYYPSCTKLWLQRQHKGEVTNTLYLPLGGSAGLGSAPTILILPCRNACSSKSSISGWPCSTSFFFFGLGRVYVTAKCPKVTMLITTLNSDVLIITVLI